MEESSTLRWSVPWGKVLSKRAVLHLSTIVTNKVHKGDSYEKVPEVWVIFVTETDFAGDGKAIHHYQFRDEKGALRGDPAHIVMVNGEFADTATLEGQIIEEDREKGREKATETFVHNVAEAGVSSDQIVRLTGASANVVQENLDRMATDKQTRIS